MISRNPTSMPAPMLRNMMQPKNSLFRAAAVMVCAKAFNTSPEAMAKKMYGKDHGLETLTRAASARASLTNTGTLAHDVVYSQLIQKITALSAAAGLMQLGMKVDLSGVASITIPGRTYNPQAAGDWIGEGQPIPVRRPTISALLGRRPGACSRQM